MNEKIGFIGTGVMGTSIIKHLLSNDRTVYIYTRSKDKATELLESGAHWVETPKSLAEVTDMIFTMVGYPTDVEEVYFSDNGLFAGGREGQYFVDMTTSTPTLAKQIAQMGKERNVRVLDAPVSGGDIGAQNGTLSIMVGGDAVDFETLYPLFQLFGENIIYQGPAGAGQHTKMSNQIAIAGSMIGACEAIHYAKSAGLDVESVLKNITMGAAGSWSLSNLAPKMLTGDMAPGFYMKHFVKDMGIALNESQEMGIDLPGLQKVKEMYDELMAEGHGDLGTQALIKFYSKSFGDQ